MHCQQKEEDRWFPTSIPSFSPLTFFIVQMNSVMSRYYHLETGNWKLETGNWKLETGNCSLSLQRPKTKPCIWISDLFCFCLTGVWCRFGFFVSPILFRPIFAVYPSKFRFTVNRQPSTVNRWGTTNFKDQKKTKTHQRNQFNWQQLEHNIFESTVSYHLPLDRVTADWKVKKLKSF